MKKSILILLIMISCIGCTSEGPHDGCDSGSLNLIFTHEGTTDDFDLSVASDIELYLYDNEGRIIEERHIPYDNIKGGRPYPFEQQHNGNVHLVTWARSGDEDINKVSPAFQDEEDYSTVNFTMSERQSRSSRTYSGSVQELFLGNQSFTLSPLEEKVIHVDVRKLLCSITVTIEEGNNFKTQYPGELSMSIAGSSESYHILEDKQSGDAITIEDNFSYIKSRDEYVSKNKVFPASVDIESGLEDNIIITLFENKIARLRVDTETKAQEGTQIDVVIRPTKQEAIITVDSWQIRKALIVL